MGRVVYRVYKQGETVPRCKWYGFWVSGPLAQNAEYMDQIKDHWLHLNKETFDVSIHRATDPFVCEQGDLGAFFWEEEPEQNEWGVISP